MSGEVDGHNCERRAARREGTYVFVIVRHVGQHVSHSSLDQNATDQAERLAFAIHRGERIDYQPVARGVSSMGQQTG